MGLDTAISALRKGKQIVLFDGSEREGECDLVIHAKAARPGELAVLRNEAGGLVCLATDLENARRMGLRFMTDILRGSGLNEFTYKKTKYGDEPAFSIYINHRSNFTGIPDMDRSTTIIEFEKLVFGRKGKKEFSKAFKSPGHVPLLIGRGLDKRRGHTELALELVRKAGLSPAVVVCEMLDDNTGKALSKKKALAWARKRRIAFVEGRELL